MDKWEYPISFEVGCYYETTKYALVAGGILITDFACIENAEVDITENSAYLPIGSVMRVTGSTELGIEEYPDGRVGVFRIACRFLETAKLPTYDVVFNAGYHEWHAARGNIISYNYGVFAEVRSPLRLLACVAAEDDASQHI